jgi:hypothetical protein
VRLPPWTFVGQIGGEIALQIKLRCHVSLPDGGQQQVKVANIELAVGVECGWVARNAVKSWFV